MFRVIRVAFGVLIVGAGADPPVSYPDHSKLLVVRDAAGTERVVKTAEDWKARRAHIVAGMEEAMGPFTGPPGSKKPSDVPLDLKIEGEETLERFVRRRISYESSDGERIPAYLLLPRVREGQGGAKLPAVLCLHQTTAIGKGEPAGIRGKESLHYAADLAARGYVTLAPDYPNFGDHAFDTYGKGYVSGSMKAIRDNARSVDLLVSLPEVDPERIGCMGHSLGGHNTLFTGVFEPRIKAFVTSCGFNAFRHYYGGDLKGWSSKTYMPRITGYGGWQRMPFDFHEVLAALAPRPVLAIGPLHDDNFAVEGVREAVSSAREVYRLLRVGDRLEAEHPDCAHDFPPAMRERAYAFFDRRLRGE